MRWCRRAKLAVGSGGAFERDRDSAIRRPDAKIPRAVIFIDGRKPLYENNASDLPRCFTVCTRYPARRTSSRNSYSAYEQREREYEVLLLVIVITPTSPSFPKIDATKTFATCARQILRALSEEKQKGSSRSRRQAKHHASANHRDKAKEAKALKEAPNSET